MSSDVALQSYIEGYGDKAYIMFFISMLAIISGSLVVFVLARKFGRAFVGRFISLKVLNKYEKYFLSKKGEAIIMLARPWEILAASVLCSSNIIIPWWSWGIIVIFAVYIVKNSDTIEEKLISVIKSLLIKS